MEQEKRHFEEIDIAKGIGILFVVIGHCFPDVSTDEGISIPFFRIVHDVIYTFHMPLMFFLAGFLSQRIFRAKEVKDKALFVKDRFVRLMIPYFSIGFLYMPVKMLLARFAAQPFDISTLWQIFLGVNPNGGLWYLYVLFLIQVVLVLVCNKNNAKYLLVISSIVSIFIVISEASFYWIDDTAYYLFFVLMGLLSGMIYEEKLQNLPHVTTWLAFSCFLLSTFCCLRFGIEALKFVCGVTGTLAVVGFSRMLSKTSGEGQGTRCLKYLGSHSMDIYVLHGMVMVAIRVLLWSLLKLNYYLCTIAMLIGGFFIPLFVSKFILRKVKIFKLLFLGEITKGEGQQ